MEETAEPQYALNANYKILFSSDSVSLSQLKELAHRVFPDLGNGQLGVWVDNGKLMMGPSWQELFRIFRCQRDGNSVYLNEESLSLSMVLEAVQRVFPQQDEHDI